MNKLNETVPIKCEYENPNWHQISRNGQITTHQMEKVADCWCGLLPETIGA